MRALCAQSFVTQIARVLFSAHLGAARALARYNAALVSIIADIGELMTMNNVISSSCNTGRPAKADATSIEAINTDPVPSVFPIAGP